MFCDNESKSGSYCIRQARHTGVCSFERAVKPVTLRGAKQIKAQIKNLEEKAHELHRKLCQKCPHEWKVTRCVHEGDCDGMGYQRVHYRECVVCKRNESLPYGNDCDKVVHGIWRCGKIEGHSGECGEQRR